MIDELNKRIIEVMVKTGNSKSTFAKELDVSLPLITHITSGRNKPGIDIIQKVLTHYKDISPDWLLLGNGQMFRETKPQIDPQPYIQSLQEGITQLNALTTTQNSVIQYNSILLDEVNHLKEINELMQLDIQKINKLSNELKSINEELKSI